MLGPVKACLVYLVGEHVFCLRSPDGDIQASEQLGEGFPHYKSLEVHHRQRYCGSRCVSRTSGSRERTE